jgi:hypothetical protein
MGIDDSDSEAERFLGLPEVGRLSSVVIAAIVSSRIWVTAAMCLMWFTHGAQRETAGAGSARPTS